MRMLSSLLVILSLLSLTTNCLAQPPVVSHNVHVIKNALPSQCKSSWKGRVGQEDVQRYGAAQNYSLSGPVVRACSHCAINTQSNDCVCRTCYDYFL